MSAQQVRPGQVWADNDKRSTGRHVLVLELPSEGSPRPRSAKVVPCTPEGEQIGGRVTWIALRRFRPTSTGYRLVQDVEVS